MKPPRQLRDFLKELADLCDRYDVRWRGSIDGSMGDVRFRGPFVEDRAEVWIDEGRKTLRLKRPIRVASPVRSRTEAVRRAEREAAEEAARKAALLAPVAKERITGEYNEIAFFFGGCAVMCAVSTKDKRKCFDAYTSPDSYAVREPKYLNDPRLKGVKWHAGRNPMYVHASNPQKLFKYLKDEAALGEADENWLYKGMSFEDAYKDD